MTDRLSIKCMTRWKKDETEFTVRLTNDGRNSIICRIPKPIIKLLNTTNQIQFRITQDGKVIVVCVGE